MTLKRKAHYQAFFPDESPRLFNAAWRQYLYLLRGSIDDPIDDTNVVEWLTTIMAEKVNNPKSTFYLWGR